MNEPWYLKDVRTDARTLSEHVEKRAVDAFDKIVPQWLNMQSESFRFWEWSTDCYSVSSTAFTVESDYSDTLLRHAMHAEDDGVPLFLVLSYRFEPDLRVAVVRVEVEHDGDKRRWRFVRNGELFCKLVGIG